MKKEDKSLSLKNELERVGGGTNKKDFKNKEKTKDNIKKSFENETKPLRIF